MYNNSQYVTQLRKLNFFMCDLVLFNIELSV